MEKNCGRAARQFEERGLSLTPEQIDFQLNFIDMLFMGRMEEITAKKQIPS